MLKHDLAALVEMTAELERARTVADQPLQRRLAGDQRRLAQVVAVEMEEVESVEKEAVRPPLAEIGLKGGKIRRACGVLDDELAVDQRLADRQRLEHSR